MCNRNLASQFGSLESRDKYVKQILAFRPIHVLEEAQIHTRDARLWYLVGKMDLGVPKEDET